MVNQPKKPKPRKKPAKIAPENNQLTPKQMAFCKWYVSGLCNFNGVCAARKAGYKGNDATLAVIASENLRKPNVAAEIKRRKAKALSGANVTVENTLRKLTVIGEKALDAGQFAPAARCAELEGKYLKMWTDRIEHVQDVENMPLEELEALLLEVTEKGGVDIGRILAGVRSRDGNGDNPSRDKKPH